MPDEPAVRYRLNKDTSADLLIYPRLGKLFVFTRGLQRQIWGFGTLLMDFMLLSGAWSIDSVSTNPQAVEMMGTTIWVLNLLVLIVIFGERALKNVIPLAERLLIAWSTGKIAERSGQ
jgi:hypothetical protein